MKVLVDTCVWSKTLRHTKEFISKASFCTIEWLILKALYENHVALLMTSLVCASRCLRD